MQHMIAGNNLCLLVPRQIGTTRWCHALVSEEIAESCVVSNKTREQNYNFPLYLYGRNAPDLLGHSDKSTSNLNPGIIEALAVAYSRPISPEEIFHYVYAILYSPVYRAQYAEFLKTDFPRIPFAKDKNLFTHLAACGKKLVNLHFLRTSDLDKPISRFQGKGDNRVQKQGYKQKETRVYINETQYFEGVEPEVWSYQIGGYQVLDKWLKDRKKRILSLEDIKHYCRVVTALAKTIKIQSEIDALYPKVEKETIPL
jgi:predicted helicase